MDRGVFDRWGVTARAFEAALDTCSTDAEIAAWLKARVPDPKRLEANRWLIEEKSSSMDRQDSEEGVAVA